MTDETKSDESQFLRHLAERFFNEAWTLIEKSDRTPAEDLRMIHLAHASRLYWDSVGDASNRSIGEWQISRVYSVLNRSEPALYHAHECLRIATEGGLKGFLLACAYEAMARALAISGDHSVCDFIARARSLAEDITDPQDKTILESDLSTIRIPS